MDPPPHKRHLDAGLSFVTNATRLDAQGNWDEASRQYLLGVDQFKLCLPKIPPHDKLRLALPKKISEYEHRAEELRSLTKLSQTAAPEGAPKSAGASPVSSPRTTATPPASSTSTTQSSRRMSAAERRKAQREARRRRKAGEDVKTPVFQDSSRPGNPASLASSPGRTKSTDSSSPIFHMKEEWKLDPNELSITDKLGEGTSATVYKGTYRDNEVGIKMLKVEGMTDEKAIKEFEYECEIMSKISSPHVLKFFGSCTKPRVCIVVEYCKRGSLWHVLQEPEIRVTWKKVFAWCKQMVRGIATLHECSPPIFHRDLKSLNLLVNKNWEVKVCDFGLSRKAEGDTATLGKMRGTMAYCAPELYHSVLYTDKSDVYSLGVIFWELVSRAVTGEYSKPYEEYPHLTHGFTVMIQVAKKGLRPTFHFNVPQEWQDLISQCWDGEPELRPSAVEVIEMLEDIERKYHADTLGWNEKLCVLKDNDDEESGEKLRRSMAEMITVSESGFWGTSSIRRPLTNSDQIELKEHGFKVSSVAEDDPSPSMKQKRLMEARKMLSTWGGKHHNVKDILEKHGMS